MASVVSHSFESESVSAISSQSCSQYEIEYIYIYIYIFKCYNNFFITSKYIKFFPAIAIDTSSDCIVTSVIFFTYLL